MQPTGSQSEVRAQVRARDGIGDRQRSGTSKIGDIEVLRGVAVLFVMIHHAHGNLLFWPNPTLDTASYYVQLWPGVDLFFAISGFVIARRLLPTLQSCQTFRERSAATFSFWIRRAWRLLPSAWFWLALLVVAPLIFNRSGAFGNLQDNFWAAVAGVFDFANFRFAFKFLQGQYYGTSFAYWSLSLEEQFYLLLPLAALVFRRWLFVPLIALVIIQFMTARDIPLMVVRTDAILLGVLLAMWSKQASYRMLEPRVLAHSRLISAVVVLLLLMGIARFGSGELTFYPTRIGWIALVSAILVFIASYDRDYVLGKGTAKDILMWVGGRSYGMYLIHIPAYCLTRELWFRLAPAGTAFDATYTVPFIVTAIVLLVILSELNFHLIEAPLRDHGARIAERWMRRDGHAALGQTGAQLKTVAGE
jgi:peptidoglycan/LPS O-acetylase OafA/YrhL